LLGVYQLSERWGAVPEGGEMSEFKCDVCGKGHATWEHRIYEKLKLAEAGVPLETLFIMPDELTGDKKVDKRLKQIRKALEGK
jgi:hypothetical protein